MALFNRVFNVLFDLLLWPFRQLPLTGLTVVSVATAIGMLLVFRATSDQKAMEEVKRQIHAGIFEIRLFSDDLRAIFRAQWEILRRNLTYFRLTLTPMLWMIVPLVIVVIQLQFHYGYRGLEPGRAATLTVRLAEEAVPVAEAADPGGYLDPVVPRPALALDSPPGIAVETPPVWIPTLREAAWRIRPDEPGDYDLTIRVAGETVTKRVRVRGDVVRRSPYRVGRGFLDQLVWPAEEPLPASSSVAYVALSYPDRDIDVLGWEIDWLIVFFVLSILFAFALRKPFDVTI